MTKAQKVTLFLFRITMGWLFFYAGYAKITDPNFTAAGYLKGAKAFTGFYGWLSGPSMIGFVNFINAWGLTILGLTMILGLGLNLSSKLGAILMILYYLPLGFPMPDAHSYIVDDHIIYAVGILALAACHAGQAWGLENWFANRFPKLRKLVG